MNTHPSQEKLSAYTDAMLDVAQMHEIARHLTRCASCRADCAALQETRDLLHHLPAPAALPREFWVNTYRQVRLDSATPRRTPSLLDALRQGLAGTQRRWAAGAAAAAVLAAALAAPILSSGHHTSLPTSSSAASAAPAQDTVDLSALVRDHTQSAAAQPLADSDRQAMLSADVDDGASGGDAGAEASGNGILLGDVSP